MMLLEPGGTRLHRTFRQQSSYAPLVEIDQDRAVVRALPPGPFIYASNANGVVFWQGKLEHTTDDGFRRGGHTKRRDNLCRVSSIGSHSHRLERLDQPIGHTCVALDQFGEAFGKNALRTGNLRTDPLAYEQLEHQASLAKSHIGNGSLIATMDP